MSSTTRFSSVSINVSVETVWDHVIETILHPDLYLPGVKEFRILRQTGQEIVRYMKTAVGEIIEKITIDVQKSEITFKLLQHPVLTGSLVNKIAPVPRNKNAALLTIVKRWQAKDPHQNVTDDVLSPKQEVMLTKHQLES